MNLFLTTRSLTSSREDHLTEFFAASLELYEHVRESFFDIAIRPFAEANGWQGCHISSIQTQQCFDETTCRLDMVLTLSNGKVVACEHKLESGETPGPDADERAQLERYLDLEIDGLMYVRSSWKPPGALVLDNRKYIQPRHREHFRWADFYALYEKSSEPFLLWMKEAFEYLGFTPPHPWIGKLESEHDRRNFAKMWDKTRTDARSRGWDVGTGSIVQLYLSDNAHTDASWIYIDPSPNRFVFRVTPKDGRRKECFKTLTKACESFAYPLEHGAKVVKRSKGEETVYEIQATAANVLGTGSPTPENIENRLRLFVSPLLLALQHA